MKLFKTDLGNYVELDSGKYLIDGNYYESSYNKKVKVENINSIQEVFKTQILTGYSLDNETFTIDEFKENILNILERADLKECEDDDGDIYQRYIFKTARDKFEYEFLNSATKIYRTDLEYRDIQCLEVVEEKFNTGNPFIKSLFSLGADKMTGIYNLNNYEAYSYELQQAFKKFNITNFTIHERDIQFTKINNEYLTNRRIFEVKEGSYCRGSLGDLTKKYQEIKDLCFKTVEEYYLSKFGITDNAIANEIKSELQILGKQIKKIETKNKTAIEYRDVVTRIEKLIEKSSILLKVKE